ncbi:MAG: hypothetical protein KQH63_18910 [Desulfobulbaceae bacterium]|nr:hypothetical protein [Desulfobulbaceae bacterium]
MKVTQVSVFLKDRAGNLTECMSLLSENDIKIQAMFLAEINECSILHFIADDPDKIVSSLKKSGFGVAESEVLLLHLPDSLHALQSTLKTFRKNDFPLKYMYMGKDSQFVFRFDPLKSKSLMEK